MEIAAGIGEEERAGEISYLTAERRRGAEERGLSIYWGRAGWNVEKDGLLYILPCDPSQSREPLQMWSRVGVEGARRKRVTVVAALSFVACHKIR